MKYSFKKLQNINKNKKEFKANAKFNHYDVNMSESPEHDFKVLEQFFYLRRQNHYLACRQPLERGGIPDIAILDTPEIIIKEIMISETDKRFDSKKYSGRKIKVK